MISNQILQSTLDGLKQITRVDMCVVDTEGVMLASTFDGKADFRDAVVSFENSPAESQVISNYQFFKVLDEGHLEYVLIASEGMWKPRVMRPYWTIEYTNSTETDGQMVGSKNAIRINAETGKDLAYGK